MLVIAVAFDITPHWHDLKLPGHHTEEKWKSAPVSGKPTPTKTSLKFEFKEKFVWDVILFGFDVR